MKPEALFYAKTHEWVYVARQELGDLIATVGLSAFAVEALTDLVYIDLPQIGRQVKVGESFSEVESVKAVSDIYAPVAGTVVAVNETLVDSPEILNQSPYTEGWIAKIQVADDTGLAPLMDYATYQRECDEGGSE